MKLLKVISFLAILALMVISMSTSGAQQTLNRKLHEPKAFTSREAPAVNFYIKHNSWESPFNPHEVLQYWIKLGAHQFNGSTILILVGNPLIDWKFFKNNHISPFKVGPKRGEITSAVVFLFKPIEKGYIELTGYGYRDILGVLNIYILNSNNTYIKVPADTHRDEIHLYIKSP